MTPASPPTVDVRQTLSLTLWRLTFRTMLSGLLRYGDRLSMAHSREVRLPFCDHRIAEFAFSLSPELLVGNGQVKSVLRHAIQGIVPPAIVSRPKQGFLPPQDGWLARPLSRFIQDLASSGRPLLDGRMDSRIVSALVDADEVTRSRESAVLWDVTNLLSWYRYSVMPMRAQPKSAGCQSREGSIRNEGYG